MTPLGEDNTGRLTSTHTKNNHADKKKNRACDMCKRRKGEKDDSLDNACQNCKSYEIQCTYALKRRVIDPDYVQFLETQLAQTQEALHKISTKSDKDDSQYHTGQVPLQSPLPSDTPSAFLSDRASRPPGLSASRFPPLPSTDPNVSDSSEDEVDNEALIQKDLLRMLEKNGHKHIGKSSSTFLLQQALEMKAAAHTTDDRGGYLSPRIASMAADPSVHNPWINSPPHQYTAQDFPEPDLFYSLIGLYFEYSNIYLPLLNRVIFMRDVNSGLHFRDESFGSTVLLVCAIGSRYSSDERVLLEGLSSTGLWYSAGWLWFRRVQQGRKILDLRNATLYDLQVPTLASIYFYGSPTIYAASANVAYAVRLAMNLGAHKRRTYKPVPNAEDELLKRAFWVMVVLDRTLSSVLGQPCCVQDEDYDLALPIECDDEHWFHGDSKLAFEQPSGKPSSVSSFIRLIKLQQIHAAALRTVYANSKSKAIWGITAECKSDLIAVLDSSLNNWKDTLPSHLNWDANMPDTRFMLQSAQLHSTYYHIQIAIHRTFIPVPSKPANTGHTALPSLTICTNAARACIHMLEGQFKRSIYGGYQNFLALFNAGIVLALNTWATKQSGVAISTNGRDLEDIFKCTSMLRALESRIYITSQSVELLKEISAIGNVPFPGDATHARRGNKRMRDAMNTYQPGLSDVVGPSNAPAPSLASRVMAGTRRVQHQVPQSTGAFNAPMYVDSNTNTSLFDPWVPPGETTYHISSLEIPGEYTSTPYAVLEGSTSSFPAQHQTAHLETFAPSDLAAGFIQPVPAPWPVEQSEMDNSANTLPQFDEDILAMLSSAPSNLEWTDWGAYIDSLTDVNGVLDISTGMSQL